MVNSFFEVLLIYYFPLDKRFSEVYHLNLPKMKGY